MERISTLDRLKAVDRSLIARLKRLRKRLPFILQAVVATSVSFGVAHEVFGHPMPFFAPISAMIVLGVSGGDRMPRAVELATGCILGVAVAEFAVPLLGSGLVQMGLTVLVTLLLASLISKSALVSNQMAIGGILIAAASQADAMVSQSVSGPSRVIDAIVGCTVGLITIGALPNNPLTAGRQEVSKVLGIASSVLHDVSVALKERDVETLERALAAVRGTQNDINRMLDAGKSGRESSRISPFMWGSRSRGRTLERLLVPVDNVIRNTRVLARRAVILTSDKDSVSEEQIDIIEELSDITLELSELYSRKPHKAEAAEIPILVNKLRQLGSRAGNHIADGGVLSAAVILAQSRSIIVDLLQACGMSRESSLAVLVPTSKHPAFHPEVWQGPHEPTTDEQPPAPEETDARQQPGDAGDTYRGAER